MTKKFKILVASVLIFGALATWAIHSGYERVNHYTTLENFGEHLRKEFPEVEHISTGTLVTLIRSSEAGIESLLLIDCRTDEEFVISHIPGAIHLETIDEVAAHLDKAIDKPQTIVVYGSVGNRSAKFARQLKEAGNQNIRNVIGSIFAWSNEDRPLIDGNGNPASKVHPFNKFWSRHLEESRKADVLRQ